MSSSRRRFLAICTDALGALIAACIAVPAAAYVLGPLRGGAGRKGNGRSFQDAGPVDKLPVGQWIPVRLELIHRDGWEESQSQHSVWVRRTGGEGKIEVFSSICPHLGCPLNWHPDHEEFVCPCHGGTFGADGQYRSGPPPRSMDPLECRVENGHLLVEWQDFKIGIAERVPVST